MLMSSTKLPLTKVLVVDVEGHTTDTRFNASLPLYCICAIEVTEDNRKIIHRYRNVEEAIAFLNQKLADGFAFVAHNAKFDYGVLKIRGLQHTIKQGVLSVACTQVMAYIKDSTRPSYSLEALTGMKTDLLQACIEAGCWNVADAPQNFWQIDWSDHPNVLQVIEDYCVQDLKATWALYKRLVAWFNDHPKFIEPLLEIEFPMLEVLAHMERHGAYVDQQLLTQLTSDLTKALDEARAQITKAYPLLPKLAWDGSQYNPVEIVFKPRGKSTEPLATNKHKSYISLYMDNDGVVVASNPYVVGSHCKLYPYNAAAATGHTYWILQQEMPELLELADSTKTGRPQLNKDYFSNIADQLPDHLPIAKVIKLEKYLTICKGLQKHIGADGRIHCNFNNVKTRTTRLATNQPNLQNIPRPTGREPDYGKRFRELFRSPSKDKVLLVADLDSIEVVVLAWFLDKVMHDSSLKDVVNTGESVHTSNSQRWGIDRNVAKTILFLLIYGGSAQLIYKRGMTKTLQEAERLFSEVDKSQPSINRLKRKCWKTAIARGRKEGCDPYVTNPFKARGLYPELVSKRKYLVRRGERQSFNYLIQKTARDILNILVLESFPHIVSAGAWLVNIIHDEVIIECDRAVAPQLKDKLNSIWNARYNILDGIRINGDFNAGDSWFEAK